MIFGQIPSSSPLRVKAAIMILHLIAMLDSDKLFFGQFQSVWSRTQIVSFAKFLGSFGPELRIFHHDLCLDSIENGISGFRLRFMISRSLISCHLA